VQEKVGKHSQNAHVLLPGAGFGSDRQMNCKSTIGRGQLLSTEVICGNSKPLDSS